MNGPTTHWVHQVWFEHVWFMIEQIIVPHSSIYTLKQKTVSASWRTRGTSALTLLTPKICQTSQKILHLWTIALTRCFFLSAKRPGGAVSSCSCPGTVVLVFRGNACVNNNGENLGIAVASSWNSSYPCFCVILWKPFPAPVCVCTCPKVHPPPTPHRDAGLRSNQDALAPR